MTSSTDRQERVQQNDGSNVDASSDMKVKTSGSSSSSSFGPTFSNLPLELRAMIWQYALPGPRVFDALTYVSAAGLQTQLLYRGGLDIPIAHVCFESRRVVQESGYVLSFALAEQPDDPGVWFHPQRDTLERTIWAPGDIHHQEEGEDGV